MSSNQLISVVLIACNSGKYINQSLQRLMSQTFKSFEVLVYNNCSTDTTSSNLDIFQMKHSDERIRVFHLIKYHSLQDIKNKALLDANGKFITFLYAEDIIGTKYLEGLIDAIRISSKQQYQPLVITGFSVQEDNNIIKYIHDIYSIDILPKVINNIHLLKNIQGKLFQKDLIIENNITFNTNFTNNVTDLLFNLEYLLTIDEKIKQKHKTVITSLFNHKYRLIIHNKNISYSYNIEQLLRAFILLLNKIDFYENYKLHLKALKSLFHHFIIPQYLVSMSQEINYNYDNIKRLIIIIDAMINTKFENKLEELHNLYKVNRFKNFMIFNINTLPNDITLKHLLDILIENKVNYAYIIDYQPSQHISLDLEIAQSLIYKNNICMLPIIKQSYADDSKENLTKKIFIFNNNTKNYENIKTNIRKLTGSFIALNNFKNQKISFVRSEFL